METTPWANSCIYGPADSPRLNETLWINPMPAQYKLCSFNCLYCRLGPSDKVASDITPYSDDIPRIDEIAGKLNRALDEGAEFDTLALSGNGEPTLYPRFSELVRSIDRIRKERIPGKTFVLLSNSTGLVRDEVREVLDLFDLPIFKLDTGKPSTFYRVNQPDPGVIYEDVVGQLRDVGSRIHLQTVFVAGPRGNMNSSDLQVWMEELKQIKPKSVEIYSINREFPGSGIEMVPMALLDALATKAENETGLPVTVFGNWE